MTEKLKNPKECFSVVRKKTFFIENELSLPEFKDGSEPLSFHHERYSRFVFIIINEEKKPTIANIPVSNMISLLEKARILARREYENQLDEKNDNSEQSIAYKITIGSGTLRGKTPAMALIENPQNENLLLNQIEWLQSNLKRYPKNKDQIEAIKEALRLFKGGSLNAEEASGRRSVEFHSSGLRPLRRKKREDGKCFVYEIKLFWDMGAESPVRVDIKNYYAPVIENEQRLLNVNVSQKDPASEIHNTFSMTLDEWMWASHVLETNIRTFENCYAWHCYRVAQEAADNNRKAAGYDSN